MLNVTSAIAHALRRRFGLSSIAAAVSVLIVVTAIITLYRSFREMSIRPGA
jgi:hypothetical protein